MLPTQLALLLGPGEAQSLFGHDMILIFTSALSLRRYEWIRSQKSCCSHTIVAGLGEATG
jgi:hypothetical protein